MEKPRRIEYEFHGFKDNETYHYWECYAKDLEEYIKYLEDNPIQINLSNDVEILK